MNYFLAKFKHWIESDRVSKTPRVPCAQFGQAPISNPSGESDEGAHPHDGLELEDGKGFVAVGPADL